MRRSPTTAGRQAMPGLPIVVGVWAWAMLACSQQPASTSKPKPAPSKAREASKATQKPKPSKRAPKPAAEANKAPDPAPKSPDRSAPPERKPAPADVVFRGGTIYAPGAPEAVAVLDGAIVFVGSAEGAKAWTGERTKIVKLGARMLMPGFVDNHNHIGEGGEVTCILESELLLVEQARELRRCGAKAREGAWVIGYGGSLALEAEDDPELSTILRTLDRALPDHPAIIMDHSSHAMFVNTLAYEEARITRATPQPQGGVFMRDARGRLNGVLIDNAGDLIMERAVNALADKQNTLYDGIMYGLKEARKVGITTVGDGRTYWRRGMMEAWRAVEADGELTARVSIRPWIYPEVPMDTQLAFLRKAHQPDTSRLLILNQVKMYVDGVPEYGTARVTRPYPDPFHPSHPHGVNYIPQAKMAAWLKALRGVGFGAHIHALGDLGVREGLNAIQAARAAGSSLKYHITHVAMVDPADIERFAALEVDADIQLDDALPTRAARVQAYTHIVGAARAKQLVYTPVRALHKAGANVVLSSDWTVNPINPLIGIAHAVEQGALTQDQALKAYTINAARALGLDAVTGTIAVGKSADLVVVSRDLTSATPAQLRRARVERTMFRGAFVYP